MEHYRYLDNQAKVSGFGSENCKKLKII